MRNIIRNFLGEIYTYSADPIDYLSYLYDLAEWRSYTSKYRLEATLGADYFFSGNKHKAQAIPPEYLKIMEAVNSKLGTDYNGIHCNYYPNGNSGIGNHCDKEPEIISSTIASLSLGASRTFILGGQRIILNHGDLIQFSKETYHSIPKEPSILDPRLSLTFRTFKPL